MKKNDDWIEVAGVGDDEEAEIIAGLLKSEGIPCEVEGESASPWPENIGSLGLTRVMVPPDRAEEAKALIAEREKEAAEEGFSEDEDE